MTVPQVNHAAPICDHFCRCTNCKPSLVGDRSSARNRVRVATAGMFVAALCLIAARATGVIPASPAVSWDGLAGQTRDCSEIADRAQPSSCGERPPLNTTNSLVYQDPDRTRVENVR